MAQLIYGMNQSLDGYVDHDAFAPGPLLFRHFIQQTGSLTGSLYGRRLYELMAYWDEPQESWSADEQAFAAAWRNNPKWVVSRSLDAVGPNATLLDGDVETAIRRLKESHEGDIEVGGTRLASSLSALGLIDRYCIYLHPVVLGRGTPFFASPIPPLRLLSADRMEEGIVKLVYAPL